MAVPPLAACRSISRGRAGRQAWQGFLHVFLSADDGESSEAGFSFLLAKDPNNAIHTYMNCVANV